MGIGNDLIVEQLKRNNEEVARKNASGEKLSFGNYLMLFCQLGLLLCSIYFSYLVISLLLELM